MLIVIDADISQYPPSLNAAELLCDAGVELTIVTRSAGPLRHPFSQSIRLRPVSPSGTGAVRLGRFTDQVIRAALRTRPRLIIGYDFTGALAARAAQHWLRSTGVGRPALVYHNHDPVAWEKKPGFRRHGRLLERRLARAADLVIVPDEQRARWFASFHELGSIPTVVRNCPRLNRRRPRPVLRNRLRALGFDFRYIVLRQQSRIGPGHGIEAILRSMSGWPDDTGLVLLGAEGVPGYVDSVARLAAECRVAGRLAVLPRVPYHELFDYTADADIGLAVYENAGLNHLYSAGASNKLYEYAAAGVPVIASADLPGYRDIVEGQGIGRCVSLGLPEQIAHAVRDLRTGPLHDRCARQGRALHASEWNYEHQFSPVLDLVAAVDGITRRGRVRP
ncbi:MAG TPA: glycosyltransferase [Gemmatimonadaceae bacterium]|nr:glycosyltransferase [Gemmatimonadaceae bacterium]